MVYIFTLFTVFLFYIMYFIKSPNSFLSLDCRVPPSIGGAIRIYLDKSDRPIQDVGLGLPGMMAA